jgi:arginine-tRNA-protein transferase
MTDDLSLLEDTGNGLLLSTSRCGYCRKEGKPRGTSHSAGVWAHQLTAVDYDELVNRGFRRSGCWLYRPDNTRSCCLAYSIRLEASQFTPSREHRRLQRRLNAFLSGEAAGQRAEEAPAKPEAAAEQPWEADAAALEAAVQEAVRACVLQKLLPEQATARPLTLRIHPPKPGARPPQHTALTCAVAHALAARCPPLPATQLAEHLAALLSAREGGLPSGLHVTAQDGHLNFVSASPTERPPAASKPPKRLLPAAAEEQEHVEPHSLTIRTRPAAFCPEEYALYSAYQAAVHDEEPGERSATTYKRFLCDSPIVPGDVPVCPGAPPCGTYHQQYRLDGKLVAVGVVDVLPSGLSSVYAFYDPEPATRKLLQLGKLTALQEIGWVASLRRDSSHSFRMYHLGLWIPSCQKMRYKGTFKPSQLLCPRTLAWLPLPEAEALFAQQGRADAAAQEEGDVDDCLVLLHRRGDVEAQPRSFGELVRDSAVSPSQQAELARTLRRWQAVAGAALAARAALVYNT